MRLADFNCDTLDLSARFSQEDFDNVAFREDAKPRDDAPLVWSFGSNEGRNEHAHISLQFPSDALGRLRLSYHQGPVPTPDVRPPYLEDCASWIGGFFKVEEVRFALTAYYTFQRASTAITLPFPLVANNEGLFGAVVSGLMLDFPKGAPLEHAHIERDAQETTISLSAHKDIALKIFDPYVQLEALNAPLKLLIGEEETDNG